MSTRYLLAAAVGLAVLVPGVASAQNGGSTPGPVTVTSEKTMSPPPNRMLLGAGAAVFGIPYVSSVLVAVTNDRGSNNALYAPLVGPWIALATRDCSNGENPCTASFVSGTLLVLDGVAQAAGLFMLGASFLVPEQKTTVKLGASAKLTVTPTKVGTSGYGIGAVGEF